MDIERNTDVLHRELEVITRVFAKIAVVLFLICCGIYAAPGQAARVPVMTTGLATGIDNRGELLAEDGQGATVGQRVARFAVQ